MKLGKTSFKIKRLPLLFGLILLISIIFIVGRQFKLPLNMQLFVIILLFIIIVLLAGVLFFLLKQRQANRGSAAIETSMMAQADDRKMYIRPEKKEEIEELERKFLYAIEKLKKSKLGKGRKGSTALYALPWYMFIGPPAAGKTTAITNSGLEFPFDSDIKGVGSTRNCDWFFSSSAIILDTAGRYMTEEEDKEEWHVFLDILKKHRRRNPINGVLAAISITDILNSSTEDLEWHARNIRRKINELINRLDTRFPVYLIFTKCDLIQGFVELFENLDRKEREQVWGCTLTFEQLQALNPHEVFDKEFQVLIRALYNFQLKRLSSPIKSENRSKIYVFPLEFSSIKESIGHFIRVLFQSDPSQENPIFRGFYFTSGTQEGVPIDRVIKAIAQKFDLPFDLISEPEIEKKSYFIKRLFTDVVIPDRDMVVQTTKAVIRRNRIRLMTLAAALIILGGFILNVTFAYKKSTANNNDLRIALENMKEVDWNDNTKAVTNFRYLQNFRLPLIKIEQNKTAPLFISWFQGDKVLSDARKLYYERANYFMEKLYQNIEEKLIDFRDVRSISRKQNDEDPKWIKRYLKAYLLMSSEVSRIKKEGTVRLDSQDDLYRVLIDTRNDIFNRYNFPLEDSGKIRSLMAQEIQFFIKSLGKERKSPFENDTNLISNIRDLLNKEPNIREIYDYVKEKEESRSLKSFKLSNEIRTNNIFKDCEIPGVFTKIGWVNHVKAAIRAESKNPNMEDWVLGVKLEQLSENLLNPEKLNEELRRIHFGEYTKSWWEFLGNIQYESFDDITSAKENLQRLGSDDSPLIQLLKKVADNTTFEIKSAKKAGFLKRFFKKFSKKSDKSKKEPILPYLVDREFRDLHSLISTEEDISEKLRLVQNQYNAASKIMENPSKNTERIEKLLKAKDEINNALKEFDVDIRRTLFEKPIIMALEVILHDTQEYLNSQWKKEVYGPFDTNLARYFPFNQDGSDARISDMSDFFDPQKGPLWRFVKEKLEPFVDRDFWQPYVWESYSIQLSPEIKDFLRQADKITKAFFHDGKFQVDFNLKLEGVDPGSDTGIEEITLNIGGEEQTYNRIRNTLSKPFVWPGRGSSSGASIKIVSNDFNPIKIESEWGWFKLLFRTEEFEQDEQSNEFKATWLFTNLSTQNDVYVTFTLVPGRRFENPFLESKYFFRIECPDRLDKINLNL